MQICVCLGPLARLCAEQSARLLPLPDWSILILVCTPCCCVLGLTRCCYAALWTATRGSCCIMVERGLAVQVAVSS